MSREGIRYTVNTIEFLKKRFRQAVDEASKVIEKQLDEKDFVKWLNKCTTILSSSSRHDTALSKLSDIVDKNQISPRWKENLTVRYAYPEKMFEGLNPRSFAFEYVFSKTAGRSVLSAKRVVLQDWQSVSTDAIYYKTSRADPIKDLYLYRKHNDRPFVIIEPYSEEAWATVVKNKYTEDGKILTSKKMHAEANAKLMMDILINCPNAVNYDDIQINDKLREQLQIELDSSNKALEEDAEENANNKSSYETPAERRKREKLTLVYTVDIYGNSTTDNVKKEIQPSVLDSYEHDLYWGTRDDKNAFRDLGTMLKWCAASSESTFGSKTLYWSIGRENTDPMMNLTFIQVAKGKIKLVDDFKSIHEMYNKDMTPNDDGIITVDDRCKLAITSYHVRNLINKTNYLHQFKKISPDVAKHWRNLNNYTKDFVYPTSIPIGWNGSVDNNVHKHLLKMYKWQVKIMEAFDKNAAIADVIRTLNLPQEFRGFDVIDLDLYYRAKAIEDYIEPLHPLLTEIPSLKNSYHAPDQELVDSLSDIIALKGLEYKNPH